MPIYPSDTLLPSDELLPGGEQPGVRSPQLIGAVGVEVSSTYVIVAPDGVTRAVFQDSTDPDWVGYLTGDSAVTGLERAAVRESADVLPEADGGVHGTFRRDRLAFTLQGIIPPDGPAGALDWVSRQHRLLTVTDALGSDATLQWTPSEAPPLQVAFREQQATRITGLRPKSFIVAGVSQDPCAYSQELKKIQIAADAGATGGGFSSPLRSPLTGFSMIQGSGIATNDGRRETWPLLTVTGPCVNPLLMNVTLNRSIQLNYTLDAGQYLLIDTNPRSRTIRLNDQSSRYSAYDYANSEWWPIAPGMNTLRVAFNSFSEGAYMIVQWRDAWG